MRLVVCADCGRKRPHQGHGLCSACYTRWHRQDPVVAERDRKASRAWKVANRDRAREYGQIYDATHKGVCLRCGGPMNRRHANGLCRLCRHELRADRRQQIAQMWNAGRSIRGIAAELGSTPNSVGTEMAFMRRDGWELPYRRQAKAINQGGSNG